MTLRKQTYLGEYVYARLGRELPDGYEIILEVHHPSPAHKHDVLASVALTPAMQANLSDYRAELRDSMPDEIKD